VSVKIRCHACGIYNTIPDHYEAVKNYCATGGMIQTLVQRIVAQPIHYHYHTPAPLWRATAFALLPAFFAPAVTLYWHIDPMWSGGLSVFCLAVGLVIGSTQVEQTEVTDEPPADEPDAEQDEPAPVPPVEVSTPFKNSMQIRMAHQPPASTDPDRQRKLGQADLSLAKLATSSAYPMNPISLKEAQRRQWPHGEPTFYEIQRHWLVEGLAFKSTTGAVYLKPSGQRTLTQYAAQ